MVRHHAHVRHADAEASAPVQAVAFALNAGSAIDAASLIHVDAAPHNGRRLLLCVEPLEPSERGLELAALALATIRDTFTAATNLPAAAALMKAFTAANAVLITENRPSAGCRWERRVYVGATGIVLSGRDMIIAQVPPTEAVIVQDGRLYAFPELASWRTDYLPPTDEPEPEPLGCREGTRPFLFRSEAASGDVITFCSSALARHLGRSDDERLAPLLTGEPETTLDYLGDLAVEHEMDDAHAAVIHIRRLANERGLPRFSLPGSKHGQATWPVVTPRVASAHRVGLHGAAEPSGLPAARPAFAVRTDWGAVGIPLDQPLPLAIASGESGPSLARRRGKRLALPRGIARPHLGGLIGRFRPQPAPSLPSGAYNFGPRGRFMTAPGVRSVRRYRDRSTFPAEWRANLPRGPELHVPSRFFTVGLILFLAFGGSGALLDRYRTQVAQADAALATVDGSLQAIIANPAEAGDSLAAAEAALRQARAAGADATTLHRQTIAVESARDQAWGNVRLQDLTLLGALPPAVSGSNARLERTGHDIWLINGALYGLDQANNRLVRVLEPGAAVQGGEINSLQAGVSDGEQLLLLDEAAVISRDSTGRWERHFLASASDEAAMLGAHPLATYQGSLYALAADGELLKFAANNLSDQPSVWVSAATYPELLTSSDLAIDGEIHVLLKDGRVLTFFRGNLRGTRHASLAVPWANPTRIVGGLDTNFLYVLDPAAVIGPTTGRIVRLDSTGSPVQILPPFGGTGAAANQSHVLSQARDFVVDEEAGLIYFITDTELWRAALPR